jgi:hypothetical protein
MAGTLALAARSSSSHRLSQSARTETALLQQAFREVSDSLNAYAQFQAVRAAQHEQVGSFEIFEVGEAPLRLRLFIISGSVGRKPAVVCRRTGTQPGAARFAGFGRAALQDLGRRVVRRRCAQAIASFSLGGHRIE